MHDVTQTLTTHYESCLAAHGPTPQGMDWGTDDSRLSLRFDAICRAIGLNVYADPVSVLDVGCGCGLLHDHLNQHWPGRVQYTGLDASSKMIAAARAKDPQATWITGDITDASSIPTADWVVANGLLTERRDIPHERMVQYAQAVLIAMFNACRVGIVFNVLSTHVNFRNEMLFYWEPGEALAFAVRQLSRHVVVHHDLEIYEYFLTVRRKPWKGAAHDR
jgi:SAM-dependent methyltransferase